jgi:hypothetical protein
MKQKYSSVRLVMRAMCSRRPRRPRYRSALGRSSSVRDQLHPDVDPEVGDGREGAGDEHADDEVGHDEQRVVEPGRHAEHEAGRGHRGDHQAPAQQAVDALAEVLELIGVREEQRVALQAPDHEADQEPQRAADVDRDEHQTEQLAEQPGQGDAVDHQRRLEPGPYVGRDVDLVQAEQRGRGHQAEAEQGGHEADDARRLLVEDRLQGRAVGLVRGVQPVPDHPTGLPREHGRYDEQGDQRGAEEQRIIDPYSHRDRHAATVSPTMGAVEPRSWSAGMVHRTARARPRDGRHAMMCPRGCKSITFHRRA